MRLSQNTIGGLISRQGDWIQDSRGMTEIINEYFDELFTSSNPSSAIILHALVNIEQSVTSDMNSILCMPFSMLDIKSTLFDMSHDKVPGPDGLSTLFYQKYWHIIGGEVTREILANLNDNALLGNWNNTIITLIPMVANPVMIKEY